MAHSCHEDDREADDPTSFSQFFGGLRAGVSDKYDILRRHRERQLMAADRRIALRAEGAKRPRRKGACDQCLDHIGVVSRQQHDLVGGAVLAADLPFGGGRAPSAACRLRAGERSSVRGSAPICRAYSKDVPAGRLISGLRRQADRRERSGNATADACDRRHWPRTMPRSCGIILVDHGVGALSL